jgi:hypothetical protein
MQSPKRLAVQCSKTFDNAVFQNIWQCSVPKHLAMQCSKTFANAVFQNIWPSNVQYVDVFILNWNDYFKE